MTQTVDLHDLVTILLHERLLTEPRFKNSRLIEINDGSTPRRSVPPHISLPALDHLPTHLPHIAYFLSDDGNGNRDPVEPLTFQHEDFTTDQPLSYADLELIFWRCRHHDSGYLMMHALQLVLDAFPDGTQLLIRTSRGNVLTTPAKNFTIAEVPITPKSMTYVCKLTKHPELGPTQLGMTQYLTGNTGEVPWVYMVFGGEEVAHGGTVQDERVAVDLVSPVLGLRGLGGEIFVMERMVVLHQNVLPRGAWEGDPLTLAGRVAGISRPLQAEEAEALSQRVLERLERIRAGGELYCSYCGKTAPKSQCASCHKPKYCGAQCQSLGWKYHKRWCKTDGKAATN